MGAYGVTTGSYQYVDANGLVQTVNYIADDVNGFRVQGTNLPVAGAANLAAPVFDGVQAPAPVFEGVQIADTEEVIAAKAAFAEAYAAQEAAHAAPEVVAPAAVTYAAGAVPVAAAAPSREAVLTTVKLNPGHAVFYRVD